MAKDKKEDSVIDIEGAFDKTERYIEENRKSLLFITGGIVVLVLIFFGWKYLYLKPRSEKAAVKMFWAEKYFGEDSFNLAINGHGDTLGFKKIVDDYGITASGNLAKYYLGVSYLHVGKFDDAIKYLKDFDTDDEFLASETLGLIGDCYSEKNQTEDAIDYYLKAAKKEPNKLTSPIFLQKAAFLYEDKGDKDQALKLYQEIKSEFPDSQEAQQVDKYIARMGGDVK